ncbi:MAG: malonyl-CoA decarboxylase domain-containing protein [Candidatus Fonsibacter ubiquis]|nr:malonyl-CoA decarboxylase family protein [Candidatus Fonsibacter ubiquis]
MLGLKKFLNFIADRSKGLFLNLFTKKKDSTSHLTDLCDQLISEDGVVSGITIAREIWQLYEKLSLEEKEIFFLQIDKKYKPNYSIIVKACKVFIDKNNETNLEILNEATEGKRQELIRRLNLAPNGTQYLVKMREDLIYFLNKHPELKSLDKDFRHLFRSWFNPGFLKLTRIKKDTDPDILQKIIKNERVHEIKSIEALYRRLENDRLFYAYFHPILDKEPLIFVQVAFTKGVGNSIQAITEGDLSNVDDYDSVTFYSISNSNKGLQQITLGNFLIKRVVFEIQQEFPKVKQFYTLSPIPGFATWFLKQSEAKIKNILKNYNSSQLYFLKDENIDSFNHKKLEDNKEALKKITYYYLTEEKFNDRPLNGVANFHLNNGASIYDIVINADLSSNGYKESFGIMVNYYYELEKIVKNHEDFVNKGKISIMNNLKEHV